MNKLIDFLEKHLLPLAQNLASTGWLVALRDAFISTLPISLTGSVAVLVKSLIIAAKRDLGWKLFYQLLSPAVDICNFVWRGSVAMFALFFALSWGYQLAKNCEVDPLGGAMTSVCAFLMSIANYAYLFKDHQKIKLDQAFNIKQLSTTGMFTALLFGGLGVSLYVLFIKARISLHISASMPPEQVVAFETAIPVMLSLFVIGGLNYLFQTVTGRYFGDWLLEIIQKPLLDLGQGFIMVLLVTALTQLFWFFGINGTSALAPVIGSIWATAQNANLLAAADGKTIPYLWTSSSFIIYGVAGSCLPLVIATLLKSQRSDRRTLAKLALAPAVFNINEPVLYCLPIILNPVCFIPFVTAPLAHVSLSYLVTKLGWVNRVQASVPGIMPPIVGPYLACNYDWRALLLSIVNLVIAVLIWLPFVKASDRMGEKRPRSSFYMPQY